MMLRTKYHLFDHMKGVSFVVMFALLPGACSYHYDNHDHPDLVTGEALFEYHCSSCHGTDGTGMLVKQSPANILTQLGREGIVNYITTPVNTQRTMPVFSNMPRAEAVLITSHLLNLQQIYDKTSINQKKPEELMIRP